MEVEQALVRRLFDQVQPGPAHIFTQDQHQRGGMADAAADLVRGQMEAGGLRLGREDKVVAGWVDKNLKAVGEAVELGHPLNPSAQHNLAQLGCHRCYGERVKVHGGSFHIDKKLSIIG